MNRKLISASAALLLSLIPSLWSGIPLQPFPLDWTNAPASTVDLSRYLSAPAGRAGFLTVRGSHLVQPDGRRFRIWGVNLCASDCFPSHDDAQKLAGDLARLGINVVRFHHMDAHWGRNIFDPKYDDTRHLDADSLDRLDFFIAELKARGIYANLNLNVHRQFKAGDGVRDWKVLGIGKSATYWNPRLIELQHEYARQLLTHRNPYTGQEYRHEPGVAVVEIVNENSVLEGWVGWRLVGRDDKPGDTWSPIPVSYAEELADLYNQWLATNVAPETLQAIRQETGVGPAGRVPRLMPNQFAQASKQRFQSEARFYMHLERQFFAGMKKLLKEELGVKSILAGTADHNDGYAAYAHIDANLQFDLVDGHGYWEHPNLGKETWIKNTPMVNDPLDATVTQFARTPVLGRPFTISEVNHPFPHEFSAEGFPILTAYALLHDWDGIYWFTWGRGRFGSPSAGIQRNGWFDFSNDPIKLTELYACGLMWHRQDIRPAQTLVTRSCTREQMLEALRMDRKERPFFLPDFARSTALQHRTRWTMEDSAGIVYPPAAPLGQINADTGQLGWFDADKKAGVVTVNAERAQALIGFVKTSGRTVPHLNPAVENEFCALLLTSLDGRPIRCAERLLLATAARGIANSGQRWKEDRKTIAEWGQGPVLIEPVTGKLTLGNLDAVKSIRALPLSPAGKPLDAAIPVAANGQGWTLTLGTPPTTWYLLEIAR